MRTDRLLKLAGALEADAKNPVGIKFDLGTWADFKGKAPKLDCGTTACAFGFAAISGIFKKEGLDYKAEIYGSSGEGDITVTFEGEEGMAAAAKFFDIGSIEAHKLFTSGYYSGKETTGTEGEMEVVKRLRAVVNDPSVFDTIQ